MESQLKIPSDTEWDELRSEDLCYKLAEFPRSFGEDVLGGIAPRVNQLDVNRLASYMLSRGAISRPQYRRLIEPPTSEQRTQQLQLVLSSATWDEDPSQFVRDFYLAVCDLYEDDGQRSHYQFAQSLRGKVLASVKCGAYDGDMKELTRVLRNVPSVVLPEEQACQLRHSLGLAESVGQGNLRDIVDEWHKQCHNPTSNDLVRALMTTPGLGRYVSGLVPYCLANCPKVHTCIGNLKEDWQLLAEYMGYSQQEVQEIQSSDATDKQFLRVWRMPNCGGSEAVILDESIQSAKKVLRRGEVNGADEVAVFDLYMPYRSSSGAEPTAKVVNVTYNISVVNGRQAHSGSPETLVREIVRQMSAQGSPLPVYSGEHPPPLKRSDGSEDSQTPMDGTARPTTTQSTTQPSQVQPPTSVTAVPSTVDGAQPLAHVSTPQPKDIAPGCYCGKVAEDHNIRCADVNTRDKNGMTGLMHACVNKHTQCVASLLELDADVDLQDKDGMTALMHACERRASECVKLLLDHRADTGPIDKYGHTCLHNKEVLTCPPVLGLLLKRTKDVDPVNMYGRTPLCEAIMLCSDEAVKLLLQHGARQVTRDPKNSTSMLELALRLKVSPEKEEAKKRIVELLMLSLEGQLLQ